MITRELVKKIAPYSFPAISRLEMPSRVPRKGLQFWDHRFLVSPLAAGPVTLGAGNNIIGAAGGKPSFANVPKFSGITNS